MTITATITIKKLEWRRVDGDWYADGPNGEYRITRPDALHVLSFRKTHFWREIGEFVGAHEARDAANASVEAFIDSWIQ